MSQLMIPASTALLPLSSACPTLVSTTVDTRGEPVVKINPQCARFSLVLGDQNLEDYEVTYQKTDLGLVVQFNRKDTLQVHQQDTLQAHPLLLKLSNDYFDKDFSCLSKHVQMQMQRYVEAGLGENRNRLRDLLYQEACQ